MDELGVQVRPLANRKEGPHAAFFAVGPLEDGDVQAMFVGQMRSRARQFFRGDAVGRCRYQLTGQFNASAHWMNSF